MIYCYYLWQNWWGLIGQSLLAFFSLAASKVISKASVFTSLLCGLGRLKGLESESRSVVSDSLWLCGLYSPYNSPGQNTRVGSLSLLQGIFPTQGLKPRSPTLQVDSLPAEPPGKPQRISIHLHKYTHANYNNCIVFSFALVVFPTSCKSWARRISHLIWLLGWLHFFTSVLSKGRILHVRIDHEKSTMARKAYPCFPPLLRIQMSFSFRGHASFEVLPSEVMLQGL